MRTCRINQKPVFAVERVDLSFRCDTELFSQIERAQAQISQDLGIDLSRSKTIQYILDQGLEVLNVKQNANGVMISFDLSDTEPPAGLQ